MIANELVHYLDRSMMFSNDNGDITLIVRHFNFEDYLDPLKNIAKVVRNQGHRPIV